MDNPVLERVGPENLSVCGIGCLTSKKHEGYRPKVEWLVNRFAEGLRILMFRDPQGAPLAFLEYVPGEFAWRPVDAKGWLFVHCLWVFPNGQKIGGLGRRLIDACVDEARQAGATGVAAMVSEGTWIVGQDIFLKCGFTQVDQADRFQLVAYRTGEGPSPRFREIGGQFKNIPGLQIVYAAQCPLLPKSVKDLAEVAAQLGMEMKITELKSAQEAQAAPSYYGVFSLLWNGRLLSDHYVSKTRFKSLIDKEIRKAGR
jgi:hypothetical protein